MFQMSSGTCDGGPYHGKNLHHHGSTFRVAIDRFSSKAIPGMIAGVETDIRFGEYRFADGIWTWHESAESAAANPVHNENR
jgi:hypothetical protein